MTTPAAPKPSKPAKKPPIYGHAVHAGELREGSRIGTQLTCVGTAEDSGDAVYELAKSIRVTKVSRYGYGKDDHRHLGHVHINGGCYWGDALIVAKL
jgi:hypothetical protein